MHRRISISKAGIVIVSMLLIGWVVNAMEITIPEEWKKQVTLVQVLRIYFCPASLIWENKSGI